MSVYLGSKDVLSFSSLDAADYVVVTDTSAADVRLVAWSGFVGAFQPLDADLTAIAALATAAYGRSLLTLASASALASEVDAYFLTPSEGNAAYQPLDATLTALAGLTIAANTLTIGTGTDAFSQTTFSANTFPARASTGNLVAKAITDASLTQLAAGLGTASVKDTGTSGATVPLLNGTNTWSGANSFDSNTVYLAESGTVLHAGPRSGEGGLELVYNSGDVGSGSLPYYHLRDRLQGHVFLRMVYTTSGSAPVATVEWVRSGDGYNTPLVNLSRQWSAIGFYGSPVLGRVFYTPGTGNAIVLLDGNLGRVRVACGSQMDSATGGIGVVDAALEGWSGTDSTERPSFRLSYDYETATDASRRGRVKVQVDSQGSWQSGLEVTAGTSAPVVQQYGRARVSTASQTVLSTDTTLTPSAAPVVYLTTSGGPPTIGAIVGLSAGDTVTLINRGADQITFSHQDAGQTAANRIITTTGAAVVLAPDGAMTVLYDGTSSRARIY